MSKMALAQSISHWADRLHIFKRNDGGVIVIADKEGTALSSVP
jgi:hypothetical protein